MITPGSANVIAGQICVAKTIGRTADEMVIRGYAGQKMATGENPKRVYGGQKKMPGSRMGVAALIRQTLTEAKNYRDKLRREPEKTERNFKLDPLIPVLNQKVAARVHAHRADDIMTAVRIGEEFGVKIVIEHGTEAYKVAAILAAKGIPVNIGPSSTSREKVELKDLVRDNAARCMAAGCHVSLITDHPVIPIADLRGEGAKLVRDHGVPMNRVLDALTRNPAVTLGVSHRVGSIAVGMDADFALFNGHPVDPSAICVMTIIDGVVVHKNGAHF
jgi:imidazolonepropionase-like amidohydrolase